MNEDFVTPEQAKTLKELGFDWKCTNYYWEGDKRLNEWDGKNLDHYHIRWDYNYDEYTVGYADRNLFENAYSAPTLTQAQKWLRKVKCIIVHVFIDDDSDEPWSYELLSTKRDEDSDWVYLVPQWKTNFYSKEPEEALSAGIDDALKYLEDRDEKE